MLCFINSPSRGGDWPACPPRAEEGDTAAPVGCSAQEGLGAWVWLTEASSGTIAFSYLIKRAGYVGEMENGVCSQGSRNHKATPGPLRSALCWNPWGPPGGACLAQLPLLHLHPKHPKGLGGVPCLAPVQTL